MQTRNKSIINIKNREPNLTLGIQEVYQGESSWCKKGGADLPTQVHKRSPTKEHSLTPINPAQK